jgi:hypothetical protein
MPHSQEPVTTLHPEPHELLWPRHFVAFRNLLTYLRSDTVIPTPKTQITMFKRLQSMRGLWFTWSYEALRTAHSETMVRINGAANSDCDLTVRLRSHKYDCLI